MIRLAEEKDIPVLLRMGKEFFDASGYDKETDFNKKDTTEIFMQLIEAGTMLTDGEGGAIGFVVFSMFMNKSYLVAQELFWWVDKDKRSSKLGLNLLKGAEEIAKELGARSMLMISLEELNGDKVNRLYKSLGYKRRETTFMRSL